MKYICIMQFRATTYNTKPRLPNYFTTLLIEKMRNKNLYDILYPINSKTALYHCLLIYTERRIYSENHSFLNLLF